MPSIKHTHMYGRKTLYIGKKPVWACGFKDCSHYQPFGTVDEAMAGRASICWNCGKTYTLTLSALDNDCPCCSDECQKEYNTAIEIGKEITIQTDPMLVAMRRRIGKTNYGGIEQTNGGGTCKKCGAPTRSPEITICIPCVMR